MDKSTSQKSGMLPRTKRSCDGKEVQLHIFWREIVIIKKTRHDKSSAYEIYNATKVKLSTERGKQFSLNN
jgi:hypothetical protein